MSDEESIFRAASRIADAGGRRAYLDAACGGDVGMRGRVEALLEGNDVLATAGCGEGVGHGVAGLEGGGARVGRYKLLQKIGEGGGGVVYMAEQEEPVRRRVALKLLKPGMDTRAVVARFEAERQALAMMEHPHIARVLDAGSTDAGRPFFVMELVRGMPMVEYCDRNRLTTEARLGLFIRVCSAIQHAHQKGIIHRDIKPSNILITLHDGVPVPKVIDFGIAKAVDQRLTDKTLFTRFEQFIGTPAYMSPEQAEMSGMDVDTRSDIYSLGVLLYELLTGRTPFDARALLDSGIDGMRRTIREVDPVPPSTKVATLAGEDLAAAAMCRAAEGARWVRLLKGDLDWIVMRCLEKDRTRRYETANGLAMDLGRYLAGEPVLARPPSAGYRFRKWAGRNRVLFVSGSAVGVALLLGFGVSVRMYVLERAALGRALAAERVEKELRWEAEAARVREAGLREGAEANERAARVAATRSEEVARFLGEMLSGVGPAVAQGRDTTLLREILERSSTRVGEDLREQPEVEASLRRTIGSVQADLGEYAAAEASFRRLIELRRAIHGPEHPEVASAIMDLGGVYDRRGGEWARAEGEYREALAMRRRLLGERHPEVLTSLQALVAMLNTQEKWVEGESAGREALEVARAIHGVRDPSVVGILGFLRWNLQGQGRLREAEEVMREEMALIRDLDGAGSMRHGNALGTLSELLRQQGRSGEAGEYLEAYLAICRVHLPTSGLRDAEYYSNFGWTLRQFGRLEDSEAMYRASLDTWRRLAGPRYHRVASEASNLASLLSEKGRWVEAEEFARVAVEVRRHNRAHDPAKVGIVVMQLAGILEQRPGTAAEVERLLVEEWEQVRRLKPLQPGQERDAARMLSGFLTRAGRLEEAARVEREAGLASGGEPP